MCLVCLFFAQHLSASTYEELGAVGSPTFPTLQRLADTEVRFFLFAGPTCFQPRCPAVAVQCCIACCVASYAFTFSLICVIANAQGKSVYEMANVDRSGKIEVRCTHPRLRKRVLHSSLLLRD